MQTDQQTASVQQPIGLIGVGLMGMALAERLIGNGFEVLGYDVEQGQRETLTGLGGRAATSVSSVLSACSRVVLSLPDTNVVAAVLGAEAALLRVGHMLVDTTTGAPAQVERLGADLAGRGVEYLDATISGSSVQVRRAEVTLLVGGNEDAFARCRDLFDCFARTAYHIGPCGSGAKMKLVTNLVLGLNRAALAEGLAFARGLELDVARTLSLLSDSMAYSRIMDTKGEKMVRGDFEPQARLTQHLKDVRLILAAAEASGLQLPLSQTHRLLLETAEAAGYGNLDNSVLIQTYWPQKDDNKDR